jgi:SOS response regulatory protein OraA/RecX
LPERWIDDYRYRFISEHRAEFGVKRLCQVLGLRRQGFHEWVAAGAAREAAAARERELVAMIASIHAEHRRAYGVPRITAELRRRGRVVNHKRVERVGAENAVSVPDQLVRAAGRAVDWLAVLWLMI